MKIAIVGTCKFSQCISNELSKTFNVKMFSCKDCTCDEEYVVDNIHIHTGLYHVHRDLEVSMLTKVLLLIQMLFLYIFQHFHFILKCILLCQLNRICFCYIYKCIKSNDSILLRYLNYEHIFNSVFQIQKKRSVNIAFNQSSGKYVSHTEQKDCVNVSTQNGIENFDRVILCCTRGEGSLVSFVWTSKRFVQDFNHLKKKNVFIISLTYEGCLLSGKHVYCVTCKVVDGISHEQVIENLYTFFNEIVPILSISHVRFSNSMLDKNDTKLVLQLDKYNGHPLIKIDTGFIERELKRTFLI
jgi:hypothetical protein